MSAAASSSMSMNSMKFSMQGEPHKRNYHTGTGSRSGGINVRLTEDRDLHDTNTVGRSGSHFKMSRKIELDA
jgi:hypothetical protein